MCRRPMSAFNIFYKFHGTLAPEAVQIDAAHITVGCLKACIAMRHKLRVEELTLSDDLSADLSDDARTLASGCKVVVRRSPALVYPPLMGESPLARSLDQDMLRIRALSRADADSNCNRQSSAGRGGRGGGRGRGGSGPPPAFKCFACGLVGHWRKDCPTVPNTPVVRTGAWAAPQPQPGALDRALAPYRTLPDLRRQEALRLIDLRISSGELKVVAHWPAAFVGPVLCRLDFEAMIG